MGKLFMAILIVTVFEGALRKWVSPSLTTPLVLLRDSLALAGSTYSIISGAFRRNVLAGQVLFLWCATVVIWGLLQLLVLGGDAIVYIAGLRFWLLYLFFAIGAALQMSDHDLHRIRLCVVWMVMLMTPLVVMQHLLPPSSPLNRQVEGDESEIFTVVHDIVRTTGTFSFTAGYTTFLAFATPLVLALISGGRKGKSLKTGWLLPVSGLVISTVVSGSRGALMFFGVLAVTYILATFVQPRFLKIRRLAALGAFICALLVIAATFGRAIDATQTRFEEAALAESLPDRVAITFLGNMDVYGRATFLGNGIGLGSNFAANYLGAAHDFLLAEQETSRVILEGGLLGIAYLGLKIFVAAIGLWKSYSVMRRTGDVLCLLLWVSAATALTGWPLLGQLTVNTLGYLLLGLATATLRISSFGKQT